MSVAAKVLHLFGAMIFVGNIITAAYWKFRADRSGDVRAIHAGVKNVMLCDYLFTIPGIVLLLGTGFFMATQAGIAVWTVFWLRTALILLTLTGVLWAAVLFPCQVIMIREARTALDNSEVSRSYWRATVVWNTVGVITVALPLTILYLMIARPT